VEAFEEPPAAVPSWARRLGRAKCRVLRECARAGAAARRRRLSHSRTSRVFHTNTPGITTPRFSVALSLILFTPGGIISRYFTVAVGKKQTNKCIRIVR
jgi:hypothetical protein